MLLEGLYLPLTTPFYPDGRLNGRKLEHNVDRVSKTPAAGLVLLGPQGEPSALSDSETREALRWAAGAAADEKVLIAGVSRDSVAGTLTLAEAAAEMHYDAALVGVPAMLALDGLAWREMLVYFQAVADRSALPVLLMSGRGGRRIPADVSVELAAHPGILGIAEVDAGGIAEIVSRTASVCREVTVTPVFAAVTGRMLRAAAPASGALVSAETLACGGTAVAVATQAAAPVKTLRTRTRQVGFQVLAGSTEAMLAGLQAGAAGVMPGFAACAPQACYEVYAAWKDGDMALAEEKQARLRQAAALVEGLGPGGIKFGCDLNGYFGGRPRLPMLPPAGDDRAVIEKAMKGLGN
jgi:4-hydroxy-2-oxoglutarate aldolase